MVWNSCFDSPVGRLVLTEQDGFLVRVTFSSSEDPVSPAWETVLLREARKQLAEYFAGERKTFDLPFFFSGTDFQQKVWQALSEIPYGKTVSYQELAEKIGNPLACRGVGMACHRNPLPVFIPCHRVIGKDGRLTGYGGGLSVKEFLLCLEQGGTYHV